LNLWDNQLTSLPVEIGQLENLTELDLWDNQLTKLPREIIQLKKLKKLDLNENLLKQPPPEIVEQGIETIFEYLRQLPEEEKEQVVNEAKMILVGQGDVGKTCLVKRLIFDTFQKEKSTEGIDILKWDITAPNEEQEEIKLNVWDFGGQEIYHATHQFFLTKRSVYLLVWNARKARDYEHIYYWLHTIEAFGEDSPIILVMCKWNERDDDLNMKDLREKFPQIRGLYKVDSEDGKGIPALREIIGQTAWNLPHMRTPWVDSWFKVRELLEQDGRIYKLGEDIGTESNTEFLATIQSFFRRKTTRQTPDQDGRDWIEYSEFQQICQAEGLDKKQTDILDEYLHDLGVTIHFRDRLELRNMVILKPGWATHPVYKVLDTQSVRDREGVLLHSELEQIWDTNVYPAEIFPKLLGLMERFELAYELPDKKSHLVVELLPSTEPEFEWDDTGNLHFHYRYDFLPAGVMTRFIVLFHQDLEEKSDGTHLCWREGAVLHREGTRALVKVKPLDRLIEIKINGSKKQELLAIIRHQFDHINNSIKRVKITKEIPCNCSEGCTHKFDYEQLLIAENLGKETVDCPVSWKGVQLSALLDGFVKKEERKEEYKKISESGRDVYMKIEQKQVNIQKQEAKQDVKQDIKIDINVKVDLPAIQSDFEELKNLLIESNPEVERKLNEIGEGLDEVSADTEKEKLKKPFNKMRRFLEKLGDEKSDYYKLISTTKKGIELAQKVGKTYNKFAQWLALPQVPDLFLGK
jgi:small GTP-binding protein